ncbi:MAG: hypothetical protein KBD14_00865 [Candidatus Pacebacteria bacterium]|nr:hypothetical protein [Candidatus Paceibacterota bacterium]
MKKFQKIFLANLLVLGILISPVLVFGQGTGGATTTSSTNSCKLPDNGTKIQDLMNYINCIFNRSVIPLLFTLALVFFTYGVVQFMLNPANEEKREKGKSYMVWGIIGLTVMVSVWGLVNILGSTFGLDTGFVPQVSPN